MIQITCDICKSVHDSATSFNGRRLKYQDKNMALRHKDICYGCRMALDKKIQAVVAGFIGEEVVHWFDLEQME